MRKFLAIYSFVTSLILVITSPAIIIMAVNITVDSPYGLFLLPVVIILAVITIVLSAMHVDEVWRYLARKAPRKKSYKTELILFSLLAAIGFLFTPIYIFLFFGLGCMFTMLYHSIKWAPKA